MERREIAERKPHCTTQHLYHCLCIGRAISNWLSFQRFPPNPNLQLSYCIQQSRCRTSNKAVDIPEFAPEAATTRKTRETDERIHSTSNPCAAIMANCLPSTLSVSHCRSAENSLLGCFPWTVTERQDLPPILHQAQDNSFCCVNCLSPRASRLVFENKYVLCQTTHKYCCCSCMCPRMSCTSLH